MPQQQPLEEALYATADETSLGADAVYGLATSLQMPQQDTEDMYDTAKRPRGLFCLRRRARLYTLAVRVQPRRLDVISIS